MDLPLVYSGEVFLPGNMDTLFQTIRQVNGILMADQQFRCSMNGLESRKIHLIHMRRMHFLFRCSYEAAGAGYSISYRVHFSPGVYFTWAALLFLLTRVPSLPDPRYARYGLFLLVSVGSLLTLLLFHLRKVSIRQFEERFGK